MSNELDDLVNAAQQGDLGALERVVRQIQDRVHHLAMRMLVNPEDALEATQEILILITTKLSTYRGESAFQTWLYRVAVNYLLSAKKSLDRDRSLNFEMFRADLENGFASARAPHAEDLIMLNELRISCTMAMLLCLDLKHRIAYVLGDILELDHGDAAEIIGISKANYRKRLSRGRAQVVAFTAKNCGLANADAKCTCPGRLPAAIALGRVRPDHISYALEGAPTYDEVLTKVRKIEGDLRTLKLQTATPQFKSPRDLGATIAGIVAGPSAGSLARPK